MLIFLNLANFNLYNSSSLFSTNNMLSFFMALSGYGGFLEIHIMLDNLVFAFLHM